MGYKSAFAAATVAGMLVAGSVQAAVVTIDFTGNAGLQSGSTMTFTQDGVSVDVTAGAWASASVTGTTSRIGQYNNGLGNTTDFTYQRVSNPIVCAILPRNCKYETITVEDSSPEVDDHIESLHGYVREFLALDFGGLNVTLLGAEFGAHSWYDDATVFVSLAPDAEKIYQGGQQSLDADDFASHSSNQFWFAADAFITDFNNSWKLKSITFSYDDSTGPGGTEVPAPAGMALLGLGLLGLGLRRRKA